MALSNESFTLGVEEEYQIVDQKTRALCSDAQVLLPKARATVGDQVTPEMYRSQIEVGTPICQTLGEVRTELKRLRTELITAARQTDKAIVAAGTHPFSHWDEQQLTRKARYRTMAADFQQLTREQLIFGCHVHVGMADREVAIQIMNRARIWLAPLLALTANSPFWLGSETGYASFRTEIWGRWPTAGTPPLCHSRAEYDQLVNDLTSTGVISDASKIYWDIRPSSHVDTLEFRVMDVCLTLDEAVLMAGLVRALARTCAWEAECYVPVRPVRTEVVQVAKWQAARFGLTDQLIDPVAGKAVAASKVINQLLTYLRPALETYGDWAEVSTLAKAVLKRGTGAERQRKIYAKKESFDALVDFMIAETARDVVPA